MGLALAVFGNVGLQMANSQEVFPPGPILDYLRCHWATIPGTGRKVCTGTSGYPCPAGTTCIPGGLPQSDGTILTVCGCF